MAGTTAKPTPDNATVAWNELAERADALITAWQGDNLPPDLAQFPPAEPPHLRRLVLVELIKIDLEYRWQHHELPKQVEEYVEEFPELSQDGEVPCDLIYEEFHIRRQIENPPQPEQYFERFPKQSDQLRRMMKLEPNQMTTTSMVGHRSHCGTRRRPADRRLRSVGETRQRFVRLRVSWRGSVRCSGWWR